MINQKADERQKRKDNYGSHKASDVDENEPYLIDILDSFNASVHSLEQLNLKSSREFKNGLNQNALLSGNKLSKERGTEMVRERRPYS